jgi:hypothetical protein
MDRRQQPKKENGDHPVKRFSTECELKRSWLHRFAGFLYSVYFIAQAEKRIFIWVDYRKSDFGAAAIAPRGRKDRIFAGLTCEHLLAGGWNSHRGSARLTFPFNET